MTKPKDSKYSQECLRITKLCQELWKSSEKPNLMDLSVTYNLPYQRLRRAYKGGANRCTRRQPNSRLDTAQEAALKQFLDHIDSIGFGIRKSMVRDAANAILAQNYTPLYDEEPPTVGLHWPARYLKQSIYNCTKAKPIETARKKA
jgi:hypothetical protein